MNTPTQSEKRGRHSPAFFALTFVAVIVWPLLGIAASLSMYDDISEAAILFGGFTAVLLLPVYMVFPASETLYAVAIIAIWLLVWIVPSVWFTSKPRTRGSQFLFLAILSGVSFAQAALGFLMILGKSV